MAKIIEYHAEPTAAQFHKDNRFFRVLMGPVGCGKSVACVSEILMRWMEHPPGPDGVRRPRWAVVRATYPELKATTIQTWLQWVPTSICPIVYDIPIRGRMQRNLADGSRLDAEILFLAVDTEQDVEKLLSFEISGAWINEASQINEKTFEYLKGRVGRWKPDKDEVPRWKGIIADTNPPPTTHWIYEKFEANTPPDEFKLYKYPPAVYFDKTLQKWVSNPDAENLGPGRLDADYYDKQILGGNDDYIRVMLAGEYGMTRTGKPVFPQFTERDHVAKEEIRADRSMPLILALDFGATLHPAAVLGQVGRLGGLVILDAFHAADESLESFMDDYVLPLLNKKYAHFKIQAVGDPAARSRSGLDKKTAFDVMAARGIRCVPASTNDFVPRKEAVDHFLNKVEGFKINPSITYLREAFGGGYVYGEIKGQKNRTKERPDKNDYSHGMDAVQYMALYVRRSSGAKGLFRQQNEKKQERFLWA